MEHGVLLLQADVDSWPSSRAATPGAVLLAVPSQRLPGAPSRQESGLAEGLECSWSDVSSWEVEGTTRQVGWPTSSGASMMLPTTPHMRRASHLALRPLANPRFACLHGPTAGRAAVPIHAMLSGM